jgi:hypothetical protein
VDGKWKNIHRKNGHHSISFGGGCAEPKREACNLIRVPGRSQADDIVRSRRISKPLRLSPGEGNPANSTAGAFHP